jgi:hypothetical protein
MIYLLLLFRQLPEKNDFSITLLVFIFLEVFGGLSILCAFRGQIKII